MNTSLFTFNVLALIFFIIPNSYGQCDVDGIFIDAVLLDPNTTDADNFDTDMDGTAETNDEFIQICNGSASTVNLSTYFIGDEAASSDSLALSGMLAAGECLVIMDAYTGTPPSNFLILAGGISFLNGGESIRLFNSATNAECTVAVGTTCPGGTINCTVWPAVNGCVTANGISNCALTPTDLNGSSLPVELISFKVKEISNIITLTWSTASETNNDRFEIERSSDGQDFYNIGTVDGRGQSSEVVNYSFEDNRPLSGMNFYRLKQVDFDEQFEYSFIVNIENGLSPGEAISLSQEGSYLSIQVSSYMKVYGYSILAYDGRQLMRGDFTQDATDLAIDLSQLEIGNYIIYTQTSEGGKAMRFTKSDF